MDSDWMKWRQGLVANMPVGLRESDFSTEFCVAIIYDIICVHLQLEIWQWSPVEQIRRVFRDN